MGKLLLSTLFEPQDASVDDSVEIGAAPVRTSPTAMQVVQNRSDEKELVYKEEIPIYLAPAWRTLESDDGQSYAWWRMEIKVSKETQAIHGGDQLVLAEHPYGNGWLHHAPFKLGSNKGTLDRPDNAIPNFSSNVEAMTWAERQKCDLWEKGRYLTAGISEPETPFSPSGAYRNVQKNALFVFGVCTDFPTFEKLLWNSPIITRLLRETKAGTIRFWPPMVRFKNGAIPLLFDEVRDDAESLMSLAIRQALAGPHKNSEKWIGQPVTKKVDQIFRGHLNARNRVVARGQGRDVAYNDALDYGSHDEPSDEMMVSLDDFKDDSDGDGIC